MSLVSKKIQISSTTMRCRRLRHPHSRNKGGEAEEQVVKVEPTAGPSHAASQCTTINPKQSSSTYKLTHVNPTVNHWVNKINLSTD